MLGDNLNRLTIAIYMYIFVFPNNNCYNFRNKIHQIYNYSHFYFLQRYYYQTFKR